jgi:hypothetical protein
VQEVGITSGGRLVLISYRPSMLADAEAVLARNPTARVTWWRLVVLQAVGESGPVEVTPELIDDGRRAILWNEQPEARG